MNTKIISDRTLEMIDQYKNFHIGNTVCSIPYFNNKHYGRRAGLRVEIGKGSPKDIFEEIKNKALEQGVDMKSFDSESLKRFLVDNDIGIDCSAFVYYLLNEESLSKKKGGLDRHLHFPFSKGIIGKIKSKIRPVENTDVKTFAYDKNSKVIPIKNAQVGDIITMTNGLNNGNRDHILFIYQIEYQNFLPIVLHYIHATAWPTDGEYGHGIHEGRIDILSLERPLVEQRWIENDKTGEENYTFVNAKKNQTKLRTLPFLC
ncbi:MAG: hypothetical protein AAB637_00750 [Patescibacteria group bacterium]